MRHALWCSSLVLLACAGVPSNDRSTLPPAAQNATEPVPTAATAENAHKLAISAAGCWFGGLWSDAEGVDEIRRAADAEARCHALVRTLYGNDDQARYERLRAFDEVAVAELTDRVKTAGQRDGLDARRTEQLTRLVQAVAAAQRELMYARRAGDRVKKDIAVPERSSKRSADEQAALAPLDASDAYVALTRLELGDLAPEARALAVLCAMDRLELARGLPKPLKVRAIGKPFQLLFGVAPPTLAEDDVHKLEPGSYLAYLTEIAQAAGHPVPEIAKSLRDRELLAWGGTLMGLADRLQAAARDIALTSELKSVADAVVRRLGNEYHADQAALLQESGGSPVPQKP